MALMHALEHGLNIDPRLDLPLYSLGFVGLTRPKTNVKREFLLAIFLKVFENLFIYFTILDCMGCK